MKILGIQQNAFTASITKFVSKNPTADVSQSNITINTQNTAFRSLVKEKNGHSEEDWFYEQFAMPSRKKMGIIPELADKTKIVNIKTQDGLDLQYFDINSGKSEKYVIFFHGVYVNALDKQHQPLFKDLSDKGINVLAVEYRGFGSNKGKVDEEGLTKDADAAYEYLIKKGIKPQDIGVIGHSLGGAVACKLATEKDVGFLVLDSTFSNAVDIGKAILKSERLKGQLSLRQKFYLLTLTAGITRPKNKFANDVYIKNVDVPILFVHCDNDYFVPLKLSKKLHEKVKERSEFVTIENCGEHEITPMKIDAISQYALKQFANLQVA